MTKLRRRAPEKRPAGAFGRHAPVARPMAERTERDRAREHIREALMVEYSFDELQQIAANMRRDAERHEEIAEMFDELGGADRVEHAFYETHLWRLAKRREGAQWTRGRTKSAALLEKLRQRHKVYYQRVIADPVRRAARRTADRRRYLRRMSVPELRDQLRARARELQRKIPKAQRTAAHKAWRHRIRRQRTPVYLRRLEKERAKWWAAKGRGDKAWLEKKKRAARECQRRRMAALRRDPAAYRALLDDRAAKRLAHARAEGREPRLVRKRWQPEMRMAA